MSSNAQVTTSEWKPRYNPWLIALPLMLSAFMVFLDTSIVVVSLPYVAGNLGATQDESTWVLTSYLVANAIFLPTSTWLAAFFGRKRFLIGCTIIFTIASLICGFAVSMPMLILARILQGIGGGAMQPLSQSIMLESFPPNLRGAASALYGLGIVVAPIIGPTLGGWLTDAYSWRWTFFINLPIGVIAVFLMLLILEDPPYIRANRSTKVDALGFTLMALFLGTLQIMLDKGQDADWFSAAWMRWFAVVCVSSFIGFVWRELSTDQPIVDLRVFKNRNFAISSVMFALFGVMIYALITLQPLFLQTLMGYSALDAGLSITPRGLGAMASLFCVGYLVTRVNPKFLVTLGFFVTGIAAFLLCQLNLQMNMDNIMLTNVMAGLGTGFIFVPLTILAIGTLSNEQISNALGLQNLLRNIGASIGLSFVATMLERYAEQHQFMMVGQMSSLNPMYQQKLSMVTAHLQQYFSAPDALLRAQDVFYRILLQQASYWSFMNLFYVIACLCMFCVVCSFVYEKPRQTKAISMAE